MSLFELESGMSPGNPISISMAKYIKRRYTLTPVAKQQWIVQRMMVETTTENHLSYSTWVGCHSDSITYLHGDVVGEGGVAL